MSSLVRLLDTVGVAAPAVRTAISRMVKQGWLEPMTCDGSPGYRVAPNVTRRLDEAAARVYRTVGDWDGTWHVIVLTRAPSRAARDRVRATLGVVGFAPLTEGTWIGPRGATDLDELLGTDKGERHEFTAHYAGHDATLVERAWDLDALAAAYVRWMSDAHAITSVAGVRPDDERAYAVRSRLVHEWRKFLHTDPGLPRTLLPESWPGERAAAFFDEQAGRLLPAASRFVDECLR